MEIPAGIHPEDRVLLLGIPEAAVVAALARCLTRGLLVAIGEDGAVRLARKAARDLDNVMFVPGPPDELPWRDGFFTVVIDAVGEWPDPEKVRREIARVTASGKE
jgi:ubiquinone/menaquinone biosynthesis C-methylase UbiE